MRWFALPVVVFASVPALAQTPAAVLRGPTVSDRPSDPTTLVTFDYAGEVRRLTAPPEEAALRLLPLEAPVRERLDLVLAQRAHLFDVIIAENLELLLRIGGSAQTGDVLGSLAMLTELYRKSEPLWSRGRLQDELRALLPTEQREPFDRLVNGYWDALVRQDAREGRARHERPPRLALLLGEKLRALGEAGERSFQQQLASGSLVYTYLRAAVGLTPDQDVQIRGFVDDFVERYGPNPAEKETQTLLVQVFSHLNGRQREALLSRFVPGAAAYAQRAGTLAAGAAPPAPANNDLPAMKPASGR
jgi:hypothetical protein